MAWIQKIQITKYVNSKGNRVLKGTPGAIKKVTKTKKWYGCWTKGKRKISVPLSVDKQASLALLSKMIKEKEFVDAGLVDPFEKQLDRKILEHLEDYINALREEGLTPYYISQRERILKHILKKLGVKTFRDLNVEAVDAYIRNMKNMSKNEVFPSAPNTKLCHRNSLVGFANWLMRKGRIAFNPLVNVNVPKGRPVHERRALTQEEIAKVFQSARERPLQEAMINSGGRLQGGQPRTLMRLLHAVLNTETRQRCLNLGEERCLIYKTAIYTGLRKGELKALKVSSIDFKSKPYTTIRLSGQFTKNGKAALISLVPSLAVEMKNFIDKHNKKAVDYLFNVADKIHVIFKRDLEAAGILYQDADGRFADFHSLRTSANTMLGVMGIPVRIRQLFMRHSDIRLTTGTYDDDVLYNQLPIIEAFEQVDYILNPKGILQNEVKEEIKLQIPSQSDSSYEI